MKIPTAKLEEQTRLPGSKFNNLFAASPPGLYDRIMASPQSNWRIASATPEKTDYMIQFDAIAWPDGIGEDQLVPVSGLDEASIASIQLESRHDKIVKTLAVAKMPITHQLVLVVASDGDTITAFPGKWLPSLNDDILKEWVFLVKK